MNETNLKLSKLGKEMDKVETFIMTKFPLKEAAIKES